MIQDQIENLIRPSVESLGYILWGCEYIPQGKYSLLRIYIDKPDGIGIADCEQVSHQVSALLDVEDPITGQYQLEVSSPGIPRPLMSKVHYELNIGSNIELKLRQPIKGRRKLEGLLKSVDDNNIIIELGDNDAQSVAWSAIVKAFLV